jgi:phosphatidylinositol kinase/protein kinase (PI-3  family)
VADQSSFRILITGESSGLVETITDAVSVHSIKKGEYAKRIAEGGFGHVSLLDHYVNVSGCEAGYAVHADVQTFGKPDSGRFARAQRNFIKSLAGEHRQDHCKLVLMIQATLLSPTFSRSRTGTMETSW